MTIDRETAGLLDRVAPPALLSEESDWNDVVTRAVRQQQEQLATGVGLATGKQRAVGQSRPARLRRALVFVLAVLACTFALSAVAAEADQRLGPVYWLFDRSETKYPLLQLPILGEWSLQERVGTRSIKIENGVRPEIRPVPVLHGEVAGTRWEMQAFFLNTKEARTMARKTAASDILCVGFNPGGTPKPYHGTDVPAFGSVTCGQPVHGVQPPHGGDVHWVGFGVSVPGPISPAGGGTGPKYFSGPAAPQVQRVDLENTNDGTVVSVPTFRGPSNFDVPARFWVAVLPLDHLVHAVVARDATGDVLERWKLPWAF